MKSLALSAQLLLWLLLTPSLATSFTTFSLAIFFSPGGSGFLIMKGA